MSTDRMSVQFHCKKCGAEEISVEDPVKDGSSVTCKACGTRFGTWKEVKEVATQAGNDELINIARRAFKK